MKLRLVVMVGLMVPLLMTVGTHAQERKFWVSGNELLEECSRDSGECWGFITGVSDALEAVAYPTLRTCRHELVTREQVINVALKALKENPEKTHHPAFDLLVDAFTAAWPC